MNFAIRLNKPPKFCSTDGEALIEVTITIERDAYNIYTGKKLGPYYKYYLACPRLEGDMYKTGHGKYLRGESGWLLV